MGKNDKNKSGENATGNVAENSNGIAAETSAENTSNEVNTAEETATDNAEVKNEAAAETTSETASETSNDTAEAATEEVKELTLDEKYPETSESVKIAAEAMVKAAKDRKGTNLGPISHKELVGMVSGNLRGVTIETEFDNEEETAGHFKMTEFGRTTRVPHEGSFEFAPDYSKPSPAKK